MAGSPDHSAATPPPNARGIAWRSKPSSGTGGISSSVSSARPSAARASALAIVGSDITDVPPLSSARTTHSSTSSMRRWLTRMPAICVAMPARNVGSLSSSSSHADSSSSTARVVSPSEVPPIASRRPRT